MSAAKATAGENLESMGAPARVGGEAVGERAAGVHPDAPAIAVQVGRGVNHRQWGAAR